MSAKSNSAKTKSPDPIRTKIKNTFCATCLSRDRNLFSIEELNLDEFCPDIPLSEAEDRVCWECKAIAVKMNEFRHKACKAQALIGNMIRRKKCDMFVHSLSDLKSVNRNDNIIIGYEVDTDNPNSSRIENVRITVDFPKKEIEYEEPDNPLSPDVDFMGDDCVEPEQDKTENSKEPLKKRKSFILAEEVSRDILLNDLNDDSNGPPETKVRTPRANAKQNEEVRKFAAKQYALLMKDRKRPHSDYDDFVTSGPSANCVSIADDPMPEADHTEHSDYSGMLKNLETESSNEVINDSTRSILQMVTQMNERLRNFSQITQRPNTVTKPITEVEELEQFEEKLSNLEFWNMKREQLSVFCTLGIGNGITSGYQVVDRLFSRDFLTKCSWSGGSRTDIPKICFKAYTRTIDLLFNVVHGSDPSMMLDSFENFLKTLLKNAMKRSQAAGLRKSRQRARKRRTLSVDEMEMESRDINTMKDD